MIVVDASAMLEVLLVTPAVLGLEERLFSADQSLHAPHLIDLEVAQVLRRYCFAGDLKRDRAEEALEDFLALEVYRYPHELFLPRVWELRESFTAYDAVYLALAEELSAPLLTGDRRLAKAAGHRVQIEVI